MRIFIAVASSETQYVKSLRSVYELERREGDNIFFPETSSYGSVTRTGLLDAFRRMTEYDAFLAVDADQKHERHALEQIRTTMEQGDLDMVCVHYYRRQTRPIQSLVYQLGDGTWPFQPYLDPPVDGVHEVASTGLGFVLIQRRVIEAVWNTLPAGDNPFDIAPVPEVGGDQQKFGSDMRFFILARQLGYRLWLDAGAGLESPHAITLWLTHKSARKLMDYDKWANDNQEVLTERLRLHGVNAEAVRQRMRILDARKRGLLIELEQLPQGDPQEQPMSIALHQLDGRMDESRMWLESLEKYPAIERPEQLPTTATHPLRQEDLQLPAEREQAVREHAAELVRELPRVESGRNGVGSG